MNLFISWSGDKSRAVAAALRDWLPLVVNEIVPFVSSKDIFAGTGWLGVIMERLQTTNFGIVCVTRDNQLSPWLNFEAGALAKTIDVSHVVPLAVDLKPSDVTLPLGQFQAKPATEEGVAAILVSINASCERPLPESLLDTATRKWWPDLDEKLAEIEERKTPADTPPRRSDRDILEELLDTVRGLKPSQSVRHDYAMNYAQPVDTQWYQQDMINTTTARLSTQDDLRAKREGILETVRDVLREKKARAEVYFIGDSLKIAAKDQLPVKLRRIISDRAYGAGASDVEFVSPAMADAYKSLAD